MENINPIPPNPKALAEALELSSEILKNLELSNISLQNIALKTSRLARLLNDFDYQKIMTYEASGYPFTTTGVTPEVWYLGKEAGRVTEQQDKTTKDIKQYMYTESIGELEENLRIVDTSLVHLGINETSV